MKAISNILYGNENYATNVTKLHSGAMQLAKNQNWTSLASEFGMSGFDPINGKAMTMFLDQLYWDDKKQRLIINDYKTNAGGKLGPGDKLQPLL